MPESGFATYSPWVSENTPVTALDALPSPFLTTNWF